MVPSKLVPKNMAEYHNIGSRATCHCAMQIKRLHFKHYIDPQYGIWKFTRGNRMKSGQSLMKHLFDLFRTLNILAMRNHEGLPISSWCTGECKRILLHLVKTRLKLHFVLSTSCHEYQSNKADATERKVHYFRRQQNTDIPSFNTASLFTTVSEAWWIVFFAVYMLVWTSFIVTRA